MNKNLRYISISHNTASVFQRGKYHISEEEKTDLVNLICNTYSDIVGLLLLVTCNRTEFYFESETTTASAILDLLVQLKVGETNKTDTQLFRHNDNTIDSVKHLQQVLSGLKSSVLGDAEIVHQIKKAYQFTIERKLQGSLLERAMQTLFKGHKRISNETHFRDGTISVAYKSLKVISDSFDRTTVKTKKILFIGAGDIVKQLFKYNSKFDFNSIYISNRTKEKAKALANKNKCKVYDWNKVLANDFEDFDVIIGAASNCHNLIKNLPTTSQKMLLIDLAVPGNIAKSLARIEDLILYDLDAISVDLEGTKQKRADAIDAVRAILQEELLSYTEWLQEAPLRSFLAEHKIIVQQKVMNHFEAGVEEQDPEVVKTITDQVIRKLRKQTVPSITPEKIDNAIAEQISFL